MLETATITMTYKDFEKLKSKEKMFKEADARVAKLEKEIENNKESKFIDIIMEKLIYEYETGKPENKGFALECIQKYCEAFNIPLEELITIEEKEGI